MHWRARAERPDLPHSGRHLGGDADRGARAEQIVGGNPRPGRSGYRRVFDPHLDQSPGLGRGCPGGRPAEVTMDAQRLCRIRAQVDLSVGVVTGHGTLSIPWQGEGHGSIRQGALSAWLRCDRSPGNRRSSSLGGDGLMIRCATRYGAVPGRLHRPPRTFALSAEFGLAYIKALLAPGSASGGLPARPHCPSLSDPAGLAG
jgi:hypothetical protein